MLSDELKEIAKSLNVSLMQEDKISGIGPTTLKDVREYIKNNSSLPDDLQVSSVYIYGVKPLEKERVVRNIRSRPRQEKDDVVELVEEGVDWFSGRISNEVLETEQVKQAWNDFTKALSLAVANRHKKIENVIFVSEVKELLGSDLQRHDLREQKAWTVALFIDRDKKDTVMKIVDVWSSFDLLEKLVLVQGIGESHIKEQYVIDFLNNLMHSEEPRLRIEAAQALVNIGADSETSVLLQRRLDVEPEENIREILNDLLKELTYHT
jgi:hypothetical protein